MTGCKQWVAGVGSDRSTNCATTTTLNINVWTEPLRLNLLGPGNGRVTYLSRFSEPIPKNSL